MIFSVNITCSERVSPLETVNTLVIVTLCGSGTTLLIVSLYGSTRSNKEIFFAIDFQEMTKKSFLVNSNI